MKKIGINKIPIGIIMNLIFGGIKMENIFGEVKTVKKEKVIELLEQYAKELEKQIPCFSHHISFELINNELLINLVYSDEKEYIKIMDDELTCILIKRLLKIHCALILAEVIPKLSVEDKVPNKIYVDMCCSYEPSKYSTEF